MSRHLRRSLPEAFKAEMALAALVCFLGTHFKILLIRR